MITVTVLKNPFSQTDKEIHTSGYVPGKTVYEYVQPYIMGLDEYVVSVNGSVVENTKEHTVRSDDWIAVCPVVGKSGSDWFRMIASVMIGNVIAAAGLTQGSMFWHAVTSATANMIGGALVNHLFPPSKADRQTYEIRPTYGWSNAHAPTDQGNALAVTYGTMRTAGQVIAQHVTSSGENQYMNILLCGGEGPIDGISDIRINDNPIANYQTKKPYNPNFSETYDVKSMGYELKDGNDWIIGQTDDNQAEGLEIAVEFPSGLYFTNSSGATASASVTLQAQYRKVGSNNWSSFTDGTNTDLVISAAQKTGFARTYRAEKLPAGKYEVKVRCLGKSGTGDAFTNTVNWKQLSSINYENYDKSKMSVDVRLGANDQAIITNFNDSYDDKGFFYELKNDSVWITDQTEGDDVDSLEITASLPYGLYYANDSGGLDSASVTVQAQYQKEGDTVWSNFDIANPSLVITAAKNTSFFKTYSVSDLPVGRYFVRMRCTAKSGTSNRYSTRVYWTQLTSSRRKESHIRPGKVLIGIKALATNQLSGGLPSITWLQTRNTVWVYNNTTHQYEQQPATNPAWAAYDMIHRCRQIKNINTGQDEFVVQGAPVSRLVYQDFASWATFCKDKNLTFNYIFNTASDLWTALQKPESVGRGKVIMRGTKFGCICDSEGNAVQLFTVGNIITDKFKETFMGIKDRANAIEISFFNKDKDYQRDIVTAYADDYDPSKPNITQVTLDGITTAEQAYREGKYRLRLNQYLQRTVEFTADIDAIACQVNDIVRLAHDVPQWGYSGRIIEATDTTLKLDREVTLDREKTYQVAVQITNPAATKVEDVQKIVIRDVQGAGQTITTDTLTLRESLGCVPSKWDLYSFGETNRTTKLFRVLSINRDEDLRRKITCIEYNEAIYDEATYVLPMEDSLLETSPEVNDGISVAEETYRQKDGTMLSNLNVSWSIPRGKLVRGYKVMYSCDDGQSWREWEAETRDLGTTIHGVQTHTTYLVKVCTVSYAGTVSKGVVSSPAYVTGKDVPPSDVPSLTATLDPMDLTKVNLSWSPVHDIDLAGYRIWENSRIIENLAKITSYTYVATENRAHSFVVKAVDNSGNESHEKATFDITPVIYPNKPTGFTAVQNGDCVYLYWNKNQATDIAGYEIRQGSTFDNGALVQTGVTGTDLSVPVNSETRYRFHIKAINRAGNYSQDAVTTEVAVSGLTPKNVHLSFDELTSPKGTHSNTEFGQSSYNCTTFASGIGRCDEYPQTQCSQVGGAIVLKLQTGKTYGEYLTEKLDLKGLIKVNLAVNFISTALLGSDNSAALWFRHSPDMQKVEQEEWKVFTPVTLTTQYIQFKVVLSSVDQTKFPIEVGTFTVSADVDDVEKTGSAIIAQGGTTVDYHYTFLGGSYEVATDPKRRPVFTPTAIGAGLRAEVISVGLSSAVVKVVNAVTGADVGGTITYRVKGYGG